MLGTPSRPVTSRTTARQSTSPATKAPAATRMRAVRRVIVLETFGASETHAASEAHGDAGGDDLIEHRGTVVRPQRHRPGDQHTGHASDRGQRPAASKGWGGCGFGHRLTYPRRTGAIPGIYDGGAHPALAAFEICAGAIPTSQPVQYA